MPHEIPDRYLDLVTSANRPGVNKPVKNFFVNMVKAASNTVKKIVTGWELLEILRWGGGGQHVKSKLKAKEIIVFASKKQNPRLKN